jgi:hypothetical protein
MTETTDYVFAEGRVPFAPVPTECDVEMRFEPDGFTYTGTPMRVLWEGAYRDAAHALIFDRDDRARVLAQTGRDIEDAYLVRIGREARARKAAA